MLFSSIPFLYYFFPVVIILYLIAPGLQLKNTVLLITSLVFYAWGEPLYVFLMIISIVSGYVFGLLIEKYRGKGAAKLFLMLSLVVSLGSLGYFKYADFFIANFNAATGLSVPLLRIALPIGISFYTFQLLSYVIDVYRGNTKAQKNFISLATYISLFPQLIAGPIVRYTDIERQLGDRSISIDKAALGLRRFVIGLGKKILIANQMGELCSIFRESGDKSIAFYWLYAIAFTIQIYFDFSGYSDMAIGLGKILGFDFMENFNYPYISGSVTEFWRRWHIPLGSWFRDYVYIPLGGNRRGAVRQIVNILVVWFLTGFWHGAAWNFIAWGLLYAFFLVIEKLFLLKVLKKAKGINHVYVMLLVILGFVLFNATDMAEAFSYIGNMFGIGNAPLVSREFFYYLRSYAVVLIAACIGATPLPKMIAGKIEESKAGEIVLAVLEPIFLMAVFIIITAFLVDGSFNPFLYFRF
ncbi:MAG: MBOAT family protein [Firmicutes bacterium]|nr:MBOAT family protein [Bacillota bacterium]